MGIWTFGFKRVSICCALGLVFCCACAESNGWSAEALRLEKLMICIQQLETGTEPFPDGAVRIETLPDGTQTISRGRFQITETTLRMYFPKLHASWLADRIKSTEIMKALLLKYIYRYPRGGAKRIAYAHFAGPDAEPYRRVKKARLAEQAAGCYEGRS